MGDSSSNPWLVGPTGAPALDAVPTALPSVPPPAYTGPAQPQRGVPELESVDRLPRRQVDRYAPVWWLGVHGGAGETTLTQLDLVNGEARHSWPISPDGTSTRVILVARANANGLLAAQRAATEWASRTLPTVQLLGLVIVADAPGRAPKPLRELAARVGGAVPRVWNLPWVEAWRLGEPVSLDLAPKEVRALMTDVEAAIRSTHPF